MRSLLLTLSAALVLGCNPDVATRVDSYESHVHDIAGASADLVQDVGQATRMEAIDRAHARYHRTLVRHLDGIEDILASFDECTIPPEEAWTLDDASHCAIDLRVAHKGLTHAHAAHTHPSDCAEAVASHHKIVLVVVEDLLAPCPSWEATLDCDPPETHLGQR